MTLTLETSRRTRKLLVIVFCLCGASTAGYRLWLDYHATEAAGTGFPIANLTRMDSAVRRKSSSSYVWERTHGNELLYRKDSIQSGPNSSASIEMKNGTRIELGENSLVIIDDVKDLSLNFMFGSFVVRETAGDRGFEVAADGTKTVTEFPLRLLTPESQEFFVVPVHEKGNVNFSWRARASAAMANGTFLEVATSRLFPAETTQRIAATKETPQISLSLPAGKYFWRISQPNLPGEVRRFQIDEAAALVPVAPVQDATLTFAGGGTNVTFQWQGGDAAIFEHVPTKKQAHTLEVSPDAEFNKIYRNVIINPESGFASIKDLPDGKYFWRLKSKLADQTFTGTTQTFRINVIKNIKVESLEPADGASLTHDQPIVFRWTSNAPDANYDLEISPAGNESAAATLTQSVNASTYLWPSPPAGTYRWRVKASAEKSTPSETPWRFLSVFEGEPVTLLTPADGSALYFWEKPAPFNLSWKPEPTAKSADRFYRVEVAGTPDFANSKFSENLKVEHLDSSALNVTPGRHFWRVRLVDNAGHALKTSAASSFTYAVHPLLEAPTNLKPAVGSKFRISEPVDFPTLSWDKKENAVSYEVSLQTSDRHSIKKTLTGTSYKTDGLIEGTYEWSVRATDVLKRPGAATTMRSFVIDLGPKLSAPEDVGAEVR